MFDQFLLFLKDNYNNKQVCQPKLLKQPWKVNVTASFRVLKLTYLSYN